MSAFANSSVDNAWVDLTVEEVPIMVGSVGQTMSLLKVDGSKSEQGSSGNPFL